MIRERKRKNGTHFQAIVKVKGSKVSRTFETHSEAEKWVNSVRYRRDSGTQTFYGPVTVEMMFQKYLENAARKNLAFGTIKAAKSRFAQHIKPFYGLLDMAGVAHEEHAYFLSMLEKKSQIKRTESSKEKPLTPVTRNHIRKLIRTMFSVAVKQRHFGGTFKLNPFDAFEPAAERSGSIKWLSRAELGKFLDANRETHYFPLLILMTKTGIRIGEALGIHAEQIDFDSQILSIDRQYDSAQRKIVSSTKGKESRFIGIVDAALDALEPLISRYPEGPIFRKEDGARLTRDYFARYVLPAACRTAKVKEINPHALRHTFAAHYLMDGGKIWDLSKILGHSSVEVTEKIYAHFDREHIRNRMRVIDGGAHGGAQEKTTEGKSRTGAKNQLDKPLKAIGK